MYEDMFICLDRIHERDGHPERLTDGQTDTAQQHRPRLCIASRGKKWIKRTIVSHNFENIMEHSVNVALNKQLQQVVT